MTGRKGDGDHEKKQPGGMCGDMVSVLQGTAARGGGFVVGAGGHGRGCADQGRGEGKAGGDRGGGGDAGAGVHGVASRAEPQGPREVGNVRGRLYRVRVDVRGSDGEVAGIEPHTGAQVARKEVGMIGALYIYPENHELFERLTDREFRELYRAMWAVNTGKEPEPFKSSRVELVWISIRNQVETNREKYAEKVDRNRRNGIGGGRPKTTIQEKPTETHNNPVGSSGNPQEPRITITELNLTEQNRTEQKGCGEGNAVPLPSTTKVSRIFWDGKKFAGIGTDDFERWSKACPLLDVAAEIVALEVWWFDNPTRRKKDARAFLSRNLARKQRELKAGAGQVSKTWVTPPRREAPPCLTDLEIH